MLIRKPTVVKPPTTAAGRVAQAISRMAALWRNRSCHERPFLVEDTILTDPPHHENSLVGLRIRSGGIALPPHRSQIRDNHLQLVPRRSGESRSALRSSRSSYGASCRLTGIGQLALPFADCSGGKDFPARVACSCLILSSRAHRGEPCGRSLRSAPRF